jgi:hypothetical protein
VRFRCDRRPIYVKNYTQGCCFSESQANFTFELLKESRELICEDFFLFVQSKKDVKIHRGKRSPAGETKELERRLPPFERQKVLLL